MKKLLIILLISALATLAFGCDSSADTALDDFYSEMERANNYTVVIHSTVTDSDVYTETVYAFDGANEYERTPESERLYVNSGANTAIYVHSGESWQQTSSVKNYDAKQFLRYLAPFFNGKLYRYDSRAKIYLLKDDAYSSLQTQGLENVWCEIDEDAVTIYYNHTVGDQKIITDMQICLVGKTSLPSV